MDEPRDRCMACNAPFQPDKPFDVLCEKCAREEGEEAREASYGLYEDVEASAREDDDEDEG